MHPEPLGWIGGRVIYACDNSDRAPVDEAARKWIEEGVEPS